MTFHSQLLTDTESARRTLLSVPIIQRAIWLIILFGQRALRRVTAEVQARAVDQLQPISDDRVPIKIQGLMAAINRLLTALDGALRHERQFTADAAHERRTPLAALQVHLSNLIQSDSPQRREHSERHLQHGISRLERRGSQLLTLSRLQPGTTELARRDVGLARIARAVIAELVDAGHASSIDVELDADGAGPVYGHEISLGVLLRNVLDNAALLDPTGPGAGNNPRRCKRHPAHGRGLRARAGSCPARARV